MAGGLGALGGVLGEVAGDGQVGDGAGAGHGDDADVELVAPADEPAGRLGRVRRGAVADGGGGVAEASWRSAAVMAGGGARIVSGSAGSCRRGGAGRGSGPRRGPGIQRLCRARRGSGPPGGTCRSRTEPGWGDAASAGELAKVAFDGLLGAPP